ncbi:MAG: hypothetical protein ABF713_10265 [Acetobacter orientalis]|uniref:hypothetical protein n=1 Tax=Acetobacter orientalis TaxID=146474 RepID=UPI000A3D3924|nr:hypothetical protein [Acetobacter orientalis]MCP1222410.1 hypothetical protein [Acetobacter orientalis]
MPHPVLPAHPASPRRIITPLPGPLPGTLAYAQQQAEADCHDMAHIARSLRATAVAISPYIARLDCQARPFAVLECAPTLLALAEEIEQDDIPARQQEAI